MSFKGSYTEHNPKFPSVSEGRAKYRSCKLKQAACLPINLIFLVFFSPQTIEKPFCYFNGFINTLFAMASVLNICSLCVYQYLSVVLPMNKCLTNFRCLVMVLCAWGVAIFFATGPAVLWGRYEFTSNIFNCEYYHSTSLAQVSYNITMMFCGYLLPLTFMLFAYVSIFKALHEHKSRIAITSSISPAPVEGAAVSTETKLCMTLAIVFVTFLICRTPFFLFLLLTTRDLENSPADFLGQLSFWAIYLHSACDPFIYAFKHTEYQETLKDILATIRVTIISNMCCCWSKLKCEEDEAAEVSK